MVEELIRQFEEYVRNRTHRNIIISEDEIHRIHHDIQNLSCDYISIGYLREIVRRYSPSTDRYYSDRYIGEMYGSGFVNRRPNDRYDRYDRDRAGNRYSSYGELSKPKRPSRLDRMVRRSNNSMYGLLEKLNEYETDTDFILEFLKDSRIEATMHNNSIIKWATKNNIIVIFDYLISLKEVSDDVDLEDLLVVACENSNQYIVKSLIDGFNVDISFGGNDLIRTSIRRNRIEVTKVLLESSNIDINRRLGDIMYQIISTKNDLVFDLIMKFSNLDFSEYDLIDLAVSYGNKYAVNALLRNTSALDRMTVDSRKTLITKKIIPSYSPRKVTATV